MSGSVGGTARMVAQLWEACDCADACEACEACELPCACEACEPFDLEPCLFFACSVVCDEACDVSGLRETTIRRTSSAGVAAGQPGRDLVTRPRMRTRSVGLTSASPLTPRKRSTSASLVTVIV